MTLIIYALLRAEDLMSLDIITRTIDLADIAIFIGVGIAITFLIKECTKRKTIAIAILMSAIMLMTVPIALDSEKYIGTRNTIFSFEVDGIEWAVSEHDSLKIQTDVQFNYVRYLFDDINDPTLVRRFFGTISFETDTLMIASERGVTIGVKDLPYGWVKINETSFSESIAESDLLYSAGPQEIGILIFKSSN